MPTPVEPTQPTAIGLSSALTRLGSSNAKLPGLEELVPVLVVGDVSRTLAGEVFEARRIAQNSATGVAAQFAVAELVARSSGGVVVEYLFVATTLAAPINPIPFVRFQLGPLGPNYAGADLGADIGGVPCVSTFRVAFDAVPPTPAGSQSFDLGCPNKLTAPLMGPNDRYWQTLGSRIFVQPGFHLCINASVAEHLEVVIVWRELADAQGGPT